MKKISIIVLVIMFITISCLRNDDTQIETVNLSIGDEHQGGIIFYIDETGEHGLIALQYDLGRDDRYLPSIDELGLIYEYKDLIGGFANEEFLVYTSSTEGHDGCAGNTNIPPCYLNNFVWDFSITPIFEDSRRITSSKVSYNLVRPIRSF